MGSENRTRTKRAMLLTGLLLLVMGLVSISVTIPYLPGGGGRDVGVPWVAAGCGVLGAAGGLWWLAQSRRIQRNTPHARTQVLRGRDGRFTFSIVMLGVCVLMQVVSVLFLEQPTVSTGLPALLALTFVNGLFAPGGEPTTDPAPDAGPSGNSGS